MKSIKNYILSQINKKFQFVKGGAEYDITIIDDVFPYIKSPWRNAEFFVLAEHFKTMVYCDKPQYNRFIPDKMTFKQMSEEFQQNYPDSKIHFKELKLFSTINTKLVYIQFYGYLVKYYKHILSHKLDFVVKLYPGGGFKINDNEVDTFLKSVFFNSQCKGVSVNLMSIYNYLIEKNIVPKEKLFLNLGGIQDLRLNEIDIIRNKKYYGKNKGTFDVAFAANKYHILGVDKGFDVFIELAKILLKKYDFINFHVVGNFTESDLPYPELRNRILFYGFQDQLFFDKFYNNIDVFISPNRQFVGNTGHIDGFPLGTSLDPALHAVTLLLTDYLNDNTFLNDKVDFYCINDGILEITEIIELLIAKPHLLEDVGIRGRNKFIKFLDKEKQIRMHLDFFKKALDY